MTELWIVKTKRSAKKPEFKLFKVEHRADAYMAKQTGHYVLAVEKRRVEWEKL